MAGTGPAARRTVDLIVVWGDVRVGDIAIHYGRLVTVNDTRHEATDDPGRTLLMLDGRWFRPRRYSLTAVRRQVEKSAEGPHAQ